MIISSALHQVREIDLLGCLWTKTQSTCHFQLFFVERKDQINVKYLSHTVQFVNGSCVVRIIDLLNQFLKIFNKLKKLQIKRIQDSAGISIRKCQTKGKKYTAQDFKTEEGVKNIIQLDEGYRVFRNLRGSPPYFEKCKKDLFAMIRQLGNPTWFCSYSAAETRWPHLLKILARIVENRNYTDDEIRDMTWQKKSELIRKDPVTCARNFEQMFRTLLNKFLRSELMPISEIHDFFYRVEFQQRGSPHIHALFWVKDAPQLGKNPTCDITAFVDKYVTCKSDLQGVIAPELINLQLHRHAKTCRKKGRDICRFNFPLLPMPSTMILQPLDLCNLKDKEIEHLKANLKKITDLLNSMKLGNQVNLTFDEFLEKLVMYSLFVTA